MRLGDWALNVAAFLGALCIFLVILAGVFGISIMMFKTGSMSPTIPAGSIAFVREAPATEIEVGDVVTVSRGDDVLPVTHRVVNILGTYEATGIVTFEMQGDANEVVDPTPYSVAEVRIVMFSVPGLARVIGWFGNPYVLGALTVAATTLVVWAFWPRRNDDDNGDGVASDEPAEQGDAPVKPPQVALRSLALAVAAVALAWTSQPGAAAEEPQPGDYLRMHSQTEPQMLNLSPGSSATWTVGVWAEAPEPGEITLSLDSSQRSSGIRDDALEVEVSSCTVRWHGSFCTGAEETPLVPSDIGELEPTVRRELAQFPSNEQLWLRVTVTMARDVTSEEAATLQLGLRLHANGLGEHIVGAPARPTPGKPQTHPQRPGLPSTGWAG